MNKKCLKCGKDFEVKRDSAKFCSTSCRVMWNRKNPSVQKKKAELRMDVIYNSILELIETHKADLPKDFRDVTNIGILKSNGNVEPMFPIKQEVRKSPAEWVMEKREIPDGDTDSYKEWFNRLEACTYLNTKQKSEIKIS